MGRSDCSLNGVPNTLRVCLIVLSTFGGLIMNSVEGVAQGLPWAPSAGCTLNPYRPRGFHPDGQQALTRLQVAHRVTQGINNSSERGNVHNTDVVINGIAYTGAVDISVRCLTDVEIKTLLERLAGAGFAGWYRKDGQDDWAGPPHIHAIWTGTPLKAVLQRQVESWLDGRTGLTRDRIYRFWQASAVTKEKVRARYRTFN